MSLALRAAMAFLCSATVCCLAGERGRPSGSACAAVDECASGLACLFGRCRSECLLDRDCPGGRCVPLPDEPSLRVCAFSDELGVPACGEPPDPWTVALYRMDRREDLERDDMLRDDAGGHDGTFQGGEVTAVDGRPGCGLAALIAPAAFGVVADHADWEIAEGSIDLRTRVPSHDGAYRVPLSRDALGQGSGGHFILVYDWDGRIAVRLQTYATAGGDTSVWRCGDAPIEPGAWVHVGVNFGPPDLELWVDGVLQDGTGEVTTTWASGDVCGGTLETGIVGNDRPWIFSGTNWDIADDDPTFEHLTTPDVETAVDEVRISSARRDFSSAAR